MPRLKLTQITVDRLTWARAVELWREDDRKKRRGQTPQRVEIWDTQLPGFGMIIRPPQEKTPKGRKTWQVLHRVNKKSVRETLGTMEQMPSVADAHEAARASMLTARKGQNPVTAKREAKAEENRLLKEEEKRKAETLGAMLRTYLVERPRVNPRGKPLSAEYLTELKRTLEVDIIEQAIGMRPMTEIEARDIKALLYDMAKTRPGPARHLHAYLRTAFNWLSDNKEVPNLLASIKSPAPAIERTRTLKEDYEIRLFWLGCEHVGWPFGPLFQLLCLLGPRRDELASATWKEFNLPKRVWALPEERAKTDEDLLTHLPELAVDILQSLPQMKSQKGYIFTTQPGGNDVPVTGFSGAWKRVETKMRELAAEAGLPAIPHFHRHDLRRTITYGMAKLGVAPHVADKILNHSGGSTIRGVMRVYNRFQYLPERKAALDLWARHIEELVGAPRAAPLERPANVINLSVLRG